MGKLTQNIANIEYNRYPLKGNHVRRKNNQQNPKQKTTENFQEMSSLVTYKSKLNKTGMDRGVFLHADPDNFSGKL